MQQRLQVGFVRVLDLVGLWEGVLQGESAVAAVAHSAEAVVVEEEEEAQDVEGAAVVAAVEEEVVDAR